MSRPVIAVRLTIERVDLTDICAPGEVLLDITESDETVLDRAVAWATVRGKTRLIPSLHDVFTGSTDGGWCAVINKPSSLVVLATWPWCPGPHDLVTLYGMR